MPEPRLSGPRRGKTAHQSPGTTAVPQGSMRRALRNEATVRVPAPSLGTIAGCAALVVVMGGCADAGLRSADPCGSRATPWMQAHHCPEPPDDLLAQDTGPGQAVSSSAVLDRSRRLFAAAEVEASSGPARPVQPGVVIVECAGSEGRRRGRGTTYESRSGTAAALGYDVLVLTDEELIRGCERTPTSASVTYDGRRLRSLLYNWNHVNGRASLVATWAAPAPPRLDPAEGTPVR